MTLSTQTWRVSAEYTMTVAGATPTALEYLTGVKAAFDAEDVIGGNYWTVGSSLLTGNMYLEFKRKGSPSGTLANVRALMFGGVAPHANALSAGTSSAATTIYMLMAENKTTDGPANAYNAGHPYNTGELPNIGTRLEVLANMGNNVTVIIVECDEMCYIFVREPGGIAHVVFGAIMEKLDSPGTAVWAHATSGDRYASAKHMTELTPAVASQFPLAITGSQGGIMMGTINFNGTGVYKQFSRCGNAITNSVTDAIYETPNTALLIPVLLSYRDNSATTSVLSLYAVLRQVRFGPTLSNKKALYNGSAVLQGYFFHTNSATLGMGIVCDNTP